MASKKTNREHFKDTPLRDVEYAFGVAREKGFNKGFESWLSFPYYEREMYCKEGRLMFKGKEYNVRFRCKNALAGAMFDRFGTSLLVEEKGEYFEFYAKVDVSVRFFGWVFGFDGGLEILSPQCVVDEYKEQLKKALKM